MKPKPILVVRHSISKYRDTDRTLATFSIRRRTAEFYDWSTDCTPPIEKFCHGLLKILKYKKLNELMIYFSARIAVMFAFHDGKLPLAVEAPTDRIHADERRCRFAQLELFFRQVGRPGRHRRRLRLHRRDAQRRFATGQLGHGGVEGVDPCLFLFRRGRVEFDRFGRFA